MSSVPVSNCQPYMPMPNLSDECPICMDAFSQRVEGDRKTYRQIAKTDCNHFFHQFCLQEHLDHGVNTNCPICRGPALEYKIIDLDPGIKDAAEKAQRNQAAQPKPQPRPQPSAPQVQNNQPQEEIDLVADMAGFTGALLGGLGALAWGTAKVGGSLLYHAAAAGANALSSAFTESPQQFDERVQKLYRKWTQLSSNFESVMLRNKEDLSVILATIRSMPESSRYRARPSVDRIEAAIEYFDRLLADNQKQLRQLMIEEQKNLSIRN